MNTHERLSRRRGRAVRTVAAALAGLLFAISAPPGRGHADPIPAEQVYQALSVDEVAADYVILVDTSESMREGGRYDQVKRALLSFLAALSPRDHVTLIAFDAVAHPPAWRQQLGTIPQDPIDRLPAVPEGDHTDLGTALEAAVSSLNRPGASAIGAVVLFTDGVHAPPARSRYPETAGRGWQELTTRADKLPQRQLHAYAVHLGDSNGELLLAKVFGKRAVRLAINSADDVLDRLEIPRRKVRAEKAAGVARADLAAGVRAEWLATSGHRLDRGANRMTVRLTSGTRKVPLELRGLKVTSTDPDVSGSVTPATVTLAPGESKTVTATVTWNAGETSWRPFRSTQVSTRLTLSGTIGSPYQEVLDRDLGVKLPTSLSAATVDATGTALLWQPMVYLAILAVLLAAGTAFLLARRNRRAPALYGYLSARAFHSDTSLGVTPVRGRAMKLPNSLLTLPGKGTASIRGRRVRVGNSGPRSTVLVIAYSPDGTSGRSREGDCVINDTVTLNSMTFAWAASREAAAEQAHLPVPEEDAAPRRTVGRYARPRLVDRDDVDPAPA